MKSDTPRTDTIVLNRPSDNSTFIVRLVSNSRQLERELNEARKDSDLLDRLEALPFAFGIHIDSDQPKSDSVPSLRSQIRVFLDERDAAIAQEGKNE